jgi:very-short-patch-repair endonuclease
LLYLGKRVLVVGDDKQISPEAVGVDRSQIQWLMRDYLFDFQHADSFDVESSLFDHGRIRFSNRITLREHFRCMPEIIHFSNDLCYRTDPLIPLRQYPPDRLEPIKFVYVSNGYREGHLQRVINRPEAEALVDMVVKCCKDERYQGMTMGVIVLQGESQAYLIAEMLLRHLGAEEMDQRRLICGNPYSFQGDERDVIFLSIVAAPNERIGPMTQAADQRRFNVAASRAQEQMWLFHSVTINELSEQCLRRRLIEYFHYPKSRIAQALGADAEELRKRAFQANRLVEKPPIPFDSWFEVDVALDIAANGYRVVPQFEFADKRIDLVIQGAKAQLAVECDGDFWHGAEEYAADMERQRKLERCNWRFFRIRESSYYAAREKSLEPLWVQLERMGITPENGFEDVESDDEHKVGGTTGSDDQECDTEPFDEDVDESPETVDGADDSISSSSGKQEGAPNTIQDALRVKSEYIGRVIVEILHERPNCSCVRESMSTYILKHWNIRTRSLPRMQFAQKVDDLVAVMARKGYLTVYKSKNVRIRLGWRPYPGFENRHQE